ncbi:MAG: FmdB family transcriptional regulator [Microbacteriaceae bacterium]|nr:MAG: FmdB family transcriptional regulator [Microbacteriaceae bacterium]
MPTYAYKCRECGNAFDVHQAFSDDALTVCPSCGGVLRKVFGTVGVTFNGSGFYRTDSRASTAATGPAKKDKKGAKEPAGAAASVGTSNSATGGSSSSAGSTPASTSSAKTPASSSS